MNSPLCSNLSRALVSTAAALVALLALPHSLIATPVTVQEVSTGLGEDVSIDSSTLGNLAVFAGDLNLTVNGMATTGFCIDPWHMSVSGPQAYTSESLSSAPKAPGPMSASEATMIETLWAQNYSATMTDQEAAGLQIAIWETESGLGGDTFSLTSSNDYGASGMITTAEQGGVHANLVALSGPGQDYTVQSVPDAGCTALLCGMGLLAMAISGRSLRLRF